MKKRYKKITSNQFCGRYHGNHRQQLLRSKKLLDEAKKLIEQGLTQENATKKQEEPQQEQLQQVEVIDA